MLKRLEAIERRYDELGRLLSLPETVSDQRKFQQLSREYAEYRPIVATYAEYRKLQHELEETQTLVDQETSADMQELIHSIAHR